jgi:micrococcal nuclease
MELENATYDNTPSFSLTGRHKAKCLKVYDGDTVTAAISLHGTIYKFQIRMLGYDTPEMYSKNDEEKHWANIAKEYLKSMVFEKTIYIECEGGDKYGRVLGTVYMGDKCINSTMMENKFCRPYLGGKKGGWEF